MKGEISPEVAWVIVHQFYIDDYLDSHVTEETARRMRTELTDVLKKGGFELCKWNSNVPSILDEGSVPREDVKTFKEVKGDEEDIAALDRILGV